MTARRGDRNPGPGSRRPIDMDTRWSLPLAALVAAVVVLAACGDSTVVADGGGEAPLVDRLDGREFWSTAVTTDGDPVELVDGTRIAVRFTTDSVSASAGCNSMGATATFDGQVLVTGAIAMTEIGCDPARHDQDEMVASLLASRPTVELDGDRLALVGTDLRVELLDRAVADPDRPLVGPTWEVTGFLRGDAVTNTAVGRPATLRFADPSTLEVFDGCAAFTVDVEVADGSVGGPVAGDAEIQFGPVDVPVAEDCADRSYAEQVRLLFATGDAIAEVDGAGLTLVNRDGVGLTLRDGSA